MKLIKYAYLKVLFDVQGICSINCTLTSEIFNITVLHKNSVHH